MTPVLSWTNADRPLVIGHRGFPSRAHENTPESFRHALDAGADGVECDVWVTADGVPVVHHDPLAGTETGDVDLRLATWSEVSQARFRSPSGIYVVSRLADAVGTAAGALLNVEIKSPDAERRAATVDAVLAVLESVEPRASVLVSSFDDEVLRAAAGRGFALAHLFRDAAGETDRPDGVEAIHPHHSLVDEALLARARDAGLSVNTWTVNDGDRAAALAAARVSAIVTDHPDRIAGALRAGN